MTVLTPGLHILAGEEERNIPAAYESSHGDKTLCQAERGGGGHTSGNDLGVHWEHKVKLQPPTHRGLTAVQINQGVEKV